MNSNLPPTFHWVDEYMESLRAEVKKIIDAVEEEICNRPQVIVEPDIAVNIKVTRIRSNGKKYTNNFKVTEKTAKGYRKPKSLARNIARYSQIELTEPGTAPLWIRQYGATINIPPQWVAKYPDWDQPPTPVQKILNPVTSKRIEKLQQKKLQQANN